MSISYNTNVHYCGNNRSPDSCTDFEPFLPSFSPYSDPYCRYAYNHWGFSDYYYGLTYQLGYPYEYGYYGSLYGYADPIDLTTYASVHKKRDWDRRSILCGGLGDTSCALRRLSAASFRLPCRRRDRAV